MHPDERSTYIVNRAKCGFVDVRLNDEGRYYCRVCKSILREDFRAFVEATCGPAMVRKLDAQAGKK